MFQLGEESHCFVLVCVLVWESVSVELLAVKSWSAMLTDPSPDWLMKSHSTVSLTDQYTSNWSITFVLLYTLALCLLKGSISFIIRFQKTSHHSNAILGAPEFILENNRHLWDTFMFGYCCACPTYFHSVLTNIIKCWCIVVIFNSLYLAFAISTHAVPFLHYLLLILQTKKWFIGLTDLLEWICAVLHSKVAFPMLSLSFWVITNIYWKSWGWQKNVLCLHYKLNL